MNYNSDYTSEYGNEDSWDWAWALENNNTQRVQINETKNNYYDFDKDSVTANSGENGETNVDEDFSSYMFGDYERLNIGPNVSQNKKFIESPEKDILTSWEINAKIKEKILEIDDLVEPFLPEELANFTWVEILVIDSLNLESLANLPPNLKKLSAFNNKIKVIESLPDTLEEANLGRNFIEEIISLPSNLKILDLTQNKIGTSQNFCNFYFPPSLKELFLSNNMIKILPDMSNLINLEILDISNNSIENYDMYPPNIIELEASCNNITAIKNLPKSLVKLFVFQNKIKMIPNLELMVPNLEEADFSFNEICFVCMLPDSIKEIDLSSNKISILGLKEIGENGEAKINYKNGNLPKNLLSMDLRNNPLKNIGEIIIKDTRIKFSLPTEMLLSNIQNSSSTSNSSQNNTNNEENTESINKYSSKNPYYIIHTKRIKL